MVRNKERSVLWIIFAISGIVQGILWTVLSIIGILFYKGVITLEKNDESFIDNRFYNLISLYFKETSEIAEWEDDVFINSDLLFCFSIGYLVLSFLWFTISLFLAVDLKLHTKWGNWIGLLWIVFLLATTVTDLVLLGFLISDYILNLYHTNPEDMQVLCLEILIQLYSRGYAVLILNVISVPISLILLHKTIKNQNDKFACKCKQSNTCDKHRSESKETIETTFIQNDNINFGEYDCFSHYGTENSDFLSKIQLGMNGSEIGSLNYASFRRTEPFVFKRPALPRVESPKFPTPRIPTPDYTPPPSPKFVTDYNQGTSSA